MRSNSSFLLKEAHKLEQKSIDEDLLHEIEEILDNSSNKTKELFENEKDKILSLSTIEKICVKYRLRFLDAELFKGEIPDTATEELKRLENKYHTKFHDLRIIAPGEYFDLEYIDKDPILLTKIAPEKYLFIHKWGSDFSKWRKWKALPFRSVHTFFLSVLSLAVIAASLFALFMGTNETSIMDFLFATFHLTVSGSLFVLFIALAFSVYPTQLNWKSKFLDF